MPSEPPFITRNKPPLPYPKKASAPGFTPPGWVPILHAIERIGKQRYGSVWTGKEWRARGLDALSGIDVIDERKLVDAGRLVGADIPSRGPVPPGLSTFSVPPIFAIQPATQDDYETERAAAIRYADVCRWLRQRLWARDIAAGILKRGIQTIHYTNWESDNFYLVASRQGIHEIVENGHLFVCVEDLDAALATLQPLAVRAGSQPIAAETKCCQWLTGEMKQQQKPVHPKRVYMAQAKRQFGVGTKQFNRAWERAKTDTGAVAWGRPGAKKKNPNP